MKQTTVVSIVNTKGGAGKTTTAANLGGLAAALGLKVLLIDADSRQPALTDFYSVLDTATSGMNEVVTRGGVIHESDIVETAINNLYLLPNNLPPSIEEWMGKRNDRLAILKRAVRMPVVRSNFDMVIIDSHRDHMAAAAAMAGDMILTPVKPDMLNYKEFCKRTVEWLQDLNSMADMAPEMKVGPVSIFVNELPRTINARLIDAAIRDEFRKHPTIRLLVLTPMQY